MNNRLLIALTMSFILLAVVVFSGCEELTGSTALTENDILVGTWMTDSYYDTLTLYSNGKCRKFRYDGTWSLENGKLVIMYSIAVGKEQYRYIYDYYLSNDNNTLTVTNIETDHTLVYNRK